MTTLEDLNLRFNPFKNITPTISDQDMVWASMSDVKSKLQRCYDDCINNNSKQIVLNWGQWGGGKTFSAYFFSKEMQNVGHLKHIYVRCPKDGAKAVDEFFTSIIDAITFDSLSDHIQRLIENHGEDALIKYLTPRATKEFAKAITLIGSQDEEIRNTMNRLLFTGLSRAELKKLGLAKDIQTDSDSIRFLAGVLSCFTGDDGLINGRVVIWLDEMEDLIYFTPKNYKSFSQSLRDLFDIMPDRFLFFMNFTLAELEESVIQLMLGDAVWSRVTRKVRYKEFSEDDALQYIEDLLSAAKISAASENPFNTEISRALINNIPINILTPREINKNVKSLLTFAQEKDKTEIDIHVFNDWVRDYAEDTQ